MKPSRTVFYSSLVITLSLLIVVLTASAALAKKTPSWWPYWEVFGDRTKCPVDDGTKWHAKYCSCWMPLGWALEPITYKTEKQWRNSQFERYWKWWSRIRMNYNAMIATKEDEAKYSSDSDKLIQQGDVLLKAANALCVADNFDSAFNAYFPDYDDFVSASVEEVRLVQQWIDLENAWIINIGKYGKNYSTVEQKELEDLYQLIWKNEKAIATADDVLKEIIGFGLGGAADFIFKQLETLLNAFKKIDEYIEEIAGYLGEAIQGFQQIVETMTNVMDQLQSKLDNVKNVISSTIGKLPLLGEKLADYINDHLDIEKIKEQFSGALSTDKIMGPMLEALKQLKDFNVDEFLKGKWQDLIKSILGRFSVALDEIKSLIPLKAYNYGQTQALQAVGSQAAHMALVANRTNRELAGLMEMQITAEHTKAARKSAARNNMVIAGKKAAAVIGGKKVKLGFN